MGASDASGIGSSLVCIGVDDCPTGMGYVQVSVRTLRSQGRNVTVRNLGIPTATIGPTFQTLGNLFGRAVLANFLDNELSGVLTNSTVVTIFAGVNEINTITAALGGGLGASNPIAYIDSQVQQFGADYATLLSGIRARAPQARIIALNVPNLAGLPFLSGVSLPQRQAAQRAAVRMTATVNGLTGQGIPVIDLMCDTRSYLASNYSADGMHPNDNGYAFIAGLLVSAVTSTSYPAPAAACGSMTIVPNP